MKIYLAETSGAVFLVRDGLEIAQIETLRNTVNHKDRIQIKSNKSYTLLDFLQSRLLAYISRTSMVADKVRELKESDIVHFRQIRVHTEDEKELQSKIAKVKRGKLSSEEIQEQMEQYNSKKITQQQFAENISGSNREEYRDLRIRNLLGHYYLPVVSGNEKSDYIQHIIKVGGEVEFVDQLAEWTKKNEIAWTWMFSKIDESLDKIYIPYYDTAQNQYRKFFPDFIFWMCREQKYRIVLVDPKGAEHTNAEHKIDGYKKLFENAAAAREFAYQAPHGKKWKVSLRLFMYNPQSNAPEKYSRYWTDSPAAVFCDK